MKAVIHQFVQSTVLAAAISKAKELASKRYYSTAGNGVNGNMRGAPG
jgi:hypothetical protein